MNFLTFLAGDGLNTLQNCRPCFWALFLMHEAILAPRNISATSGFLSLIAHTGRMVSQGIPVVAVLRTLEKVYDPPKTFLRFRTPFDLLVVTILSAQCTDARVNIVSKSLFARYKKPEDYLRVAGRAGTRYQVLRHIPEQSQIHPGTERHSVEEIRRKSAQLDAGTDGAPRRGSQNGFHHSECHLS